MDQETPHTSPKPAPSADVSEIETKIFRELIEIVPDAIVIINRSGHMVYINHQTEIVFGYHRDELIDQHLDTLVPNRFRAAHHKHRAEYYKHPRIRPMGTKLELFGKRKDGSEFPVEISLGPYITKGETLVISAIRDISERKQMQAEREQLIQEQGIILAREQTLLETNRRMDEFISIAGHELKTPLTFLKGGVQVILRRIKRLTALTDDAEYRERYGSIEELLQESSSQITRLERLVHDLLEVSRTQSDRMIYQDEQFDLIAVIHETIAEHSTVNPDRSILFAPVQNAQVTVQADSVRIRQVLTNYLTNALKYSDASYPVEVEAVAAEGEARVFVRDKGIGISADEIDHIWERFYRIKGTKVISGSGIGLGLGLYLSKTIVQHSGGSVGVQSTVGEGTTFWFSLPLSSAQVSSGEASTSS